MRRLARVFEKVSRPLKCHSNFLGGSHIYVTGSAKRYTNAHTMIFLYKCCCSKTRNIFYSLKKKLGGGLRYLQLFAYTHAKIEELNVLLTGQARSLKTAT